MERSEVVSFIKSQLLSRLSITSSTVRLMICQAARIEDVNVNEISYEPKVGGGTNFFGKILVEAVKEVGITRSSFTSTLEGYFDEFGIYLNLRPWMLVPGSSFMNGRAKNQSEHVG
jgi:hypothetical protein